MFLDIILAIGRVFLMIIFTNMNFKAQKEIPLAFALLNEDIKNNKLSEASITLLECALIYFEEREEFEKCEILRNEIKRR